MTSSLKDYTVSAETVFSRNRQDVPKAALPGLLEFSLPFPSLKHYAILV